MSKNSATTLRRFREVHYHRYKIGTRSNVNGSCVLRSQLPVRLPRPHTMQLIYGYPPPGIGHQRFKDAVDEEDRARVWEEVAEEQRQVEKWLRDSMSGMWRHHVVVAARSGVLIFVAGFGYWNVLDIDLKLQDEACVGVKAFDVASEDSLPVLIMALTTYVKRKGSESRDESGTYRLYALGAESLPPLPQELLTDREPSEAAQQNGQPMLNEYAYLEERLFALKVTEKTPFLDLEYLPYRISQDVAPGKPPQLLVAGNDNKVHRYVLGCNGMAELEPILGPPTEGPFTFTAFDGRAIGPYHVQIMAQQEFVVSLQATILDQRGGGSQRRRQLMVADEEVFDSAPILTTVFAPSMGQADRTAVDHVVSQKIRDGQITPGDSYDSQIDAAGQPELPRVHAVVGFVGEDAVVYHDVPIAGLDPAPTLVGGLAGRVPDTAQHISGRLGGRGGVFSLPNSAKEGMITSVHFDDLDFDGTKEILVGTVSGATLIYKEVESHGYVLVWKRQFPAPVYAIFSADINCDGVNELVVITLLGVHILQPNLAMVRAKLLRQLILSKQ